MYLPVVLVSTLAAVATAHQNIHQFWVNGVSPGYEIGIRKAPSNSPVTDVTSNDITCNVNGNKVPSGVTTIAAKAGDSIKVQWDSSTHPGPITHMLFGPVADASQATGVGSWVKVDEQDYVSGKWANEIMMAANMTHEFKLPAKLASGDYLVCVPPGAWPGRWPSTGINSDWLTCNFTAPQRDAGAPRRTDAGRRSVLHWLHATPRHRKLGDLQPQDHPPWRLQGCR